MDLQFWIYVIIAIIYIVSRAMKKADSQPKDLPGPRADREVRYDSTPPLEKPKQLTFEELLREITETKQPQKPAYQPVPQPKAEYVDYDDQIGEEEQNLEDVNYDYR